MLKFIGQAVYFENKQFITNKTIGKIKVTINNSGTIITKDIESLKSETIVASRTGFGTFKAYVTVVYIDTGAELEYEFGVSADNTTDYADIYEDHVSYNRKPRGKITKPTVLIPSVLNGPLIDLNFLPQKSNEQPTLRIEKEINSVSEYNVKLSDLTVSALRDLCYSRNIPISGTKSKSELINTIQTFELLI